MKEQIKRFVERAEDALGDARHLYQNERVLAVANRAYYTVFYCVCALLASEGIYPDKHQTARAKFSEFFIENARFDVQASKIVGNSFAARQAADYDLDAFISDAEARLLLDDAKTFYDLTLTYFAQNPVA
ncbi:HEPN domain-containing protein [Spirosoma spitsbergense]|uniref:HEPN domain-containing protein n=1 Tax=Spirosoma spitsbergense TaxID=431554 RepID=UPI000378168D|nr:HEPN domain-containing protein [Spirosoma spitsbergense]